LLLRRGSRRRWRKSRGVTDVLTDEEDPTEVERETPPGIRTESDDPKITVGWEKEKQEQGKRGKRRDDQSGRTIFGLKYPVGILKQSPGRETRRKEKGVRRTPPRKDLSFLPTMFLFEAIHLAQLRKRGEEKKGGGVQSGKLVERFVQGRT